MLLGEEQKKEVAFLITSILLALFLSLALTSFFSYSIFGFTIITSAEQATYNLIAPFGENTIYVPLGLSFLAGIFNIYMLMLIIYPPNKAPSSRFRKWMKFTLAFLAFIAIYCSTVISIYSSSFYLHEATFLENLFAIFKSMDSIDVLIQSIVTILTGVLWAMGRVLSPYPKHVIKGYGEPSTNKCFALGVGLSLFVVAIVAIYSYGLSFSMFGDDEYELSLIRILKSTASLMFYFTFLVLSISVSVFAFSPKRKSLGTRASWLSASISICLLFFAIAGYMNRGQRALESELSKGLVKAAGLDSGEQTPWKVLLFDAEEDRGFALIDWPLESRYMNLTCFEYNKEYGFDTYCEETIPVSRNNLKKIERFAQKHINRSDVYNNLSQTIYYGYFSLWDEIPARRTLADSARRTALSRVMMSPILHWMPSTKDNADVIREFMNSENWHPNYHSVKFFSKAMFRFGHPEKAEHWLELGRENGIDVAEIEKDVRNPPLLGILSGKVLFNGITMDGVKAVLLRKGHIGRRFLDHEHLFGASRNMTALVSSQFTDSNGSFKFTGLNEEEYYVALVFDKRTASSIPDKSSLSIDNIPVPVMLNSTAPSADLGAIRISFN
ncbi:MAG: hypothetical protein KAR83_01810 [Thermodesulfovibrionales bacterium]|nr:hypothetical protein [Thermodesulfovibrionales bacterium]